MIKTIAAAIFGLILLLGGINHFLQPAFYNPFIPDFLPPLAVNYIIGVVEIFLGIGLCLPKYRNTAALGALLLMIAFTPLHLWDVWREDPVIGSPAAAWIRLGVQGVFIAWMYWIYRSES